MEEGRHQGSKRCAENAHSYNDLLMIGQQVDHYPVREPRPAQLRLPLEQSDVEKRGSRDDAMGKALLAGSSVSLS
ncbi:hypothetical protein KTAU_21120 [Thermogemmatispora aurantia]|uniref:Uncharacterized protein n=1 Tax=Thermogemmatispora aurantia TaxID=2045279 RepID=A0A5J4K7G2_9CHLR|nr:hypothetical protein KTAU_21120 [Thermogemmatispora aurantia]